MEDSYIELTVSTKPKFVEVLADFIGNFTQEAVEIGDSSVVLRTTNDTKALEDELSKLEIESSVKKEQKQNIDWIKSYQDSVEPIEAGGFYIHPEWYPPMKDKINVLINPALAFGSGHHATTFSCLQMIGKYVRSGDRLLDVGCGSGILALSARKLGANVELCDVDPQSIQSTKENFDLNNEKYEKIWEGSVDKADGKYDVVVANIIADVLRAISLQLKSTLKEGSILILSGILDKKESIVTDSFTELTLVERIQKDEWITLVYKPSTKG